MDLRPEERYFYKEAYIQQIITWKDIQGNTKTNAKRNHNERLYTFQNGLRLKKKKDTAKCWQGCRKMITHTLLWR